MDLFDFFRKRKAEPASPSTPFPLPHVRHWIRPGRLDQALMEEIEAIRAVDTHEHLEEESARLGRPADLKPFIYLYALSEMVSAGMPASDAELFNRDDIPARDQWALVRRWWPLARNTIAAEAAAIAMKELYGVDDLSDATLGSLIGAMERVKRPGFYRWALREAARVECSMVNLSNPVAGELCMDSADPELILYDISVAPLLADDLKLGGFEKAAGIACGGIRDWLRIIDRQFERWAPVAPAIKNQCAYWRPLSFAEVSEEEAGRAFEKWLLNGGEVSVAERRAVQDFTFHHCIRRAIDCHLPVKIHTGFHAWNNCSDPAWFQPRDLAPLFRLYPQARFDLFHAGYPEHLDALYLAKHYSNVRVDMCWAWILDPAVSLDLLRHYAGALPSNKVFAFGGDYPYPDNVCGHLRIAREGVGLVLTEMAADGLLTREDAKTLARRWLRENALEFFRVEEKRSNALRRTEGERPATDGSIMGK